MHLVRRVLTALASGYVIYFFSETLFWGRFNPETPTGEFVAAWLVYSLMTMILLTVISRFRVRSFWSLFLAASIYGWTAEGIYVQTMYDKLPSSISFTGLAWHAMFSVCMGWYALRWVLAHGSVWRLATVSLSLGLFWGLWSVFWWIELGTKTPREEYVYYAVLSGILLVIALALENVVQPKDFRASAWEAWILFGIAATWFVLIVAAASPWKMLVLVPLMTVVFLALRKNRRDEDRPDLMHFLRADVAWYRYLFVFLTPFSAIAVYLIVWLGGQGLPTNYVVYALSTPAGFVFLVVSLIKVFSRRPKTAVALPHDKFSNS